MSTNSWFYLVTDDGSGEVQIDSLEGGLPLATVEAGLLFATLHCNSLSNIFKAELTAYPQLYEYLSATRTAKSLAHAIKIDLNGKLYTTVSAASDSVVLDMTVKGMLYAKNITAVSALPSPHISFETYAFSTVQGVGGVSSSVLTTEEDLYATSNVKALSSSVVHLSEREYLNKTLTATSTAVGISLTIKEYLVAQNITAVSLLSKATITRKKIFNATTIGKSTAISHLSYDAQIEAKNIAAISSMSSRLISRQICSATIGAVSDSWVAHIAFEVYISKTFTALSNVSGSVNIPSLKISATVTSVGDVSATELDGWPAFEAKPTAESSTYSWLTGKVGINAIPTQVSDVSGMLNRFFLNSTITPISSSTSHITYEVAIVSTVAAYSETDGHIRRDKLLITTVTPRSDAVAHIYGKIRIGNGTIVGRGSTLSHLTGKEKLSSTNIALSNLEAHATIKGVMRGTVEGLSTSIGSINIPLLRLFATAVPRSSCSALVLKTIEKMPYASAIAVGKARARETTPLYAKHITATSEVSSSSLSRTTFTKDVADLYFELY